MGEMTDLALAQEAMLEASYVVPAEIIAAAREAVAERDAAERAWLEWLARGSRGRFVWPREKHEYLRGLLSRYA